MPRDCTGRMPRDCALTAVWKNAIVTTMFCAGQAAPAQVWKTAGRAVIKISVIVPVYNGEKYLKSCLESIAGQSLDALEIIVVDNGSTDCSAAVIHQFMDEWEARRKILFIKEEQQGNAFARNIGMRAATGEFLAFVDQDDSMDREFLEQMYAQAQALKADVLAAGCRAVNLRGATTRMLRLTDDPWSPFRMVAPWAKLYKRTLIEDHHLQFLPVNKGEDVYFVFHAYNCASRLRTVPLTGYRWLANPESFSHTEHRKIDRRNSILPLFDALQESLFPLQNIERDFLEYFYIKTIVHETMFCAGGKSFEAAYGYYSQLREWIDRNYPDNEHNRYVGIMTPGGEELKRRIFVAWVWHMKKRGSVGTFLRLYTRCLQLCTGIRRG